MKGFILICSLLAFFTILTVLGQSQPIVQFSANSYTIAESLGAIPLTVQRSGDTNNALSVDYATSDGTATNGLKYTAVSGTLTFRPGETNQTIAVPILNDGFVQGTKTFRVNLSNPTGGSVLGVRLAATVSITDNDVGIQFQFPANSVAEDGGEVLLRVVREDDGILPVTVDFFTTDLTAKNGIDYTGITNTLSFAAQERLKLVPIPILNNSLKQPNRTFRASLANPAGASLGSQKTTIITIVDNDQGFQFQFASYSALEDAGAVRIGVLRGTDEINSPVTVDIATADGTAVSGLNYTGITNTLSFAADEKSKQISILILNDGVKESAKTFRVTLRNPTARAMLGSPATTTITILDNDPGVGFEQTDYTNAWRQSSDFTLTVLRGNDSDLGPMTVDYSTSDLTAKAGQDYRPVSGTLEFQAGETLKTLAVPILQPRAGTEVKRFRVILSNPTGGATLGKSSTTVNIVGTYAAVTPPFDTVLTIGREGILNLLTWNGGGQMQRADTAAGPWQTFTNANSPFTVASPVATTFFRVTLPRPVNLFVPSRYEGKAPMPLVILLHGYGWSGAEMEDWMRFEPLAEARGFLYCYPDSMIDQWGYEFWNATDACCDFASAAIDDAGYLRGLIEEIGRRFAVDQKRVYLVGHSNGGYLSYRMACQSADLIAAIVSLAGSTFMDPSHCAPSEPVNILQIHGTADRYQFYAGGANVSTTTEAFHANLPPFPSALQSVQTWAGYNDAVTPVTDDAPTLDLTTDVAGLDTVVTRFTNESPGGAVELWTIQGGTHYPTLSAEFSPRVIDWLLAHPKP